MTKFFRSMNESDYKFVALKELIPNGFSNNGVDIILPEGSTDKVPTQEQLDAKIKELKAEYEKQNYARARAESYDPISEQLDMQYWDKVNGTNKWQEAVAKVKADNPKPE